MTDWWKSKLCSFTLHVNRDGNMETAVEFVGSQVFKDAMNGWNNNHPLTEDYVAIKEMCESGLKELQDKVERACGYQRKSSYD